MFLNCVTTVDLNELNSSKIVIKNEFLFIIMNRERVVIIDNYFKPTQMLTCISKLSLFIGNLLMSIIIFFYMSFLHDLSQLSAGVSLWHSTVLEVYVLATISLIGTILGFIKRHNHMKKICAYTILGYLLSILSINAYYHKRIYFYFPMQMLVGFICILPFIISFPYILAPKDSLK